MQSVRQEGKQVFRYASRKMHEASLRLLERNNLTVADVDVVLPHQANRRIIEAATTRLGVDPAKVIVNIDRFANTTAGTIPLAMQAAVDRGMFKKDSLALLCAVAAVCSVCAALVR